MDMRFFSWNEEFRNEVSVGDASGKEHTVDWNFHGLFDIKKLKPEHFKEVEFKKFFQCFRGTIELEMEFCSDEMEAVLNSLFDAESDYYILSGLDMSYKHPWTVFDYFLSGFKLSQQNHTITLIEVGQD